MEDCKGMHTEVTEKDVFGWLLDKEEEKLNEKDKALRFEDTN